MYRKIGLLPGIAILVILFIHANGFGINALLWWTHRYQTLLPIDYNPITTPQYYIMVFLKQALFFGVPAFLFVSGFFTSYAIDRGKGNIQWSTIKTRIATLLIPYLIWTFIDLIIRAGIGHIYTPGKYLVIILFGLNGYFFIPVLIIFYLISPLLIFIAKINWKLLLTFSGLLQLVYILLSFTLLSYNSPEPVQDFFLSGQKYYLIFNWFFYFPLGLVFGIYLPEFKKWLLMNLKLILVLCITLLITAYSLTIIKGVYVKAPEDWVSGLVHLIIQTYCAAIILAIIGILELKNIQSKSLVQLGGLTLGIYLTHFLFMTYFTKFVYHFIPNLLNYQMFFSLLVYIIGLGGSLILISIVKNSSMKRFYPYLFG